MSTLATETSFRKEKLYVYDAFDTSRELIETEDKEENWKRNFLRMDTRRLLTSLLECYKRTVKYRLDYWLN